MAVRMKNIAKDLGISAMAVSKALRDHPDIGKETKERVRKRAAELGYRVDHIARSMVTGRTYLVGLVVPDLMQSFFTEIATALTAAIAPAGYHLIIAHTGEDAAREAEDIDVLVARKVDGLVIATAQRDPERLRGLDTPFVLVDRRPAGLDAHYVGSNDHLIGRMATEHLIARGCRTIAHLAGGGAASAEGRLAGYRAALAQHGLAGSGELVVEAGHDDAAGYRAMRDLLERGSRPDGLFAFNDPVAVGAMKAALEAGLAIPGDIAIAGVANMHYSEMMRVPLTTVDQDAGAIGREAARILLGLMAGTEMPTARTIVEPRLVPRASTVAAK